MRAGGKTFGRGQTVIPRARLPRGALALAFVVAAAAAVILALPYIASNRIISDRIALEMSDWSGYAVSIGSAPEIRIWPDFGAVLTDVSLRPRGTGDGPPVMESERIEIELSPLAALSGEVVFHSARLVRPVLNLRETAAGLLLPAPPGGGRIARAIDGARDAVRADGPDAEELPADLFGSVELVDGTIVADGAEVVSGIAGKIDWPALNRPGFVKAEGIWRGEAVALDVASSSPLILLAGSPADVSASLRSAPASLRFEGTASFGDDPSFEGQGKFLAPSLRRFLEWSDAGAGAGSGAPAEPLGVESGISANAGRVRFEEAAVTVGEAAGSGVIDLVVARGRPAVSGTLAFGSLDLASLLSAFTPSASSPGNEPGTFPSEFADRVSLDLRVSAPNATFGKIALSDVAATARVSEEGAAFDISDAAAFGGSIQAGIRFRQDAGRTDLELRLLASEIDGGAFGAAAGIGGIMPIGRGNVSVILAGPGRTWQTFLGQAGGSISADFGPGALPRFNLQRFLERVAKGGFFALGEVAEGTLPIDAAEMKATVAGGVARIDKAEARWPSTRLLLSGVVSIQGRGLALSGSIGPAAGAPLGPVQHFFVGGSWASPYITPVPGSRAE